MKLLNKLFKRDGIIRNRKVTKARFLYLYVITGAIGGLAYFFGALAFGLPYHWALSPLYLLIGFIAVRFVLNNGKSLWLYVRDVEQGKLLMFLNDNTHWSEDHKLRVVNYVYLKRKTIRSETHAKISNQVRDGKELSFKDKIRCSFKPVFCPQQILIGFNEALLVNALIYAHNNIQVLDEDLRDIMNLTDDHILAFNLKEEFEKAGGDEFNKYMEIGQRNSQNLN